MNSPVSLPGTRASIRRRAGRRVATQRIYNEDGVLVAAAGQPIPDGLEVAEDQAEIRDDVPGTTTREASSTDRDAALVELDELRRELAVARERIAELEEIVAELPETDDSTGSPDHDDTAAPAAESLDDLTVNQLLDVYDEYGLTPPKNAKRADLIAGLKAAPEAGLFETEDDASR